MRTIRVMDAEHGRLVSLVDCEVKIFETRIKDAEEVLPFDKKYAERVLSSWRPILAMYKCLRVALEEAESD